MDNKDIDKTHIVALKEESGKFLNVSIPIEKPEQFIAELTAMVNNTNRTVWDMQSHFTSRFPKGIRYIDYIYPHSYNASYVSGTEYPALKEYGDLTKSWSEAAQKVSTEYAQKCESERMAKDEPYLTCLIEDTISKLKLQQKRSFLQKSLMWIDAWCYQEATKSAERSASIKMFSKENIGWNTFRHNISNDIKIELSTNFGYGSAAYFLLGVKYKNIAILPYSYIVRYYKVGMADIVRCTRSYEASRNSWCAAFDFLSDFINSSTNNPESFVKTYIMREVEEMMQGLEAIALNPMRYMDNISNTKAAPCVVNVRHMFVDERKRVQAYPSETPILFKVEKLTGALDFLKSLSEISQEVSDVQKHINRLVELNLTLIPEIEIAIEKNDRKISEKNVEKGAICAQIAAVDEKLNPYEEEIFKCRQALAQNQFFSMDEYERLNPEYKLLKEKKNGLSSTLFKVNQTINDFKSFNSILKRSLSKVNDFKEVSEAA